MTISKIKPEIIFTLVALFSVSFVASIFLMQLVAAIIFLMWLFENWDHKKNIFNALTISVYIFGFARLISIIFSHYPELSYQAFYKEALFYLILPPLCFYLKDFGKEKLIGLIYIFILGACFISLVGSIRFISGFVERAQSFTSGYMVFSGYLLAALSLALFVPKGTLNTKAQWYWSIILLVLFIGIILSLGRTNILIAALVFIIAILLKKINIKQLLMILFLGAAFVILLIIFPIPLVESRFENITQLSDRDIIWQGAISILFEHPVFGYGPRTFREIFPLLDMFADKGIGSWHNDFLQIYFDSGLLGLTAFIFLIITTITVSLNQIRNKKIDADLRNLSASILVAIISQLLSSITSGFITSAILSIVFVFFISMLYRIEVERKTLTSS